MEIMKVKDLKSLLTTMLDSKQVEDDYEIWLSSDEEGNSFGYVEKNTECSLGIEGNKVILYPCSSQSPEEIFDD